MSQIKLSICIATFNRGPYIGETLDSIIPQLTPEVELVVVNGASPDNTDTVLNEYKRKCPQLKYFCESTNSGVDRDYDKAVEYASGQYCWLMTDDDLQKPGAIQTVLNIIQKNKYDLILANAELRSTDFSVLLDENRIGVVKDIEFDKSSNEAFFKTATTYLAFIGGVIIRRDFWLSRSRSPYYGSLFIHVGVIFQNPPLENVYIISQPLLIIRHGNSMWTSRSFEIWNFKWQQLIWSFEKYPEKTKDLICHKEPWRNIKTLLYARAMGSYTQNEYKKFIANRLHGLKKIAAQVVSVFPTTLANFIVVTYFCFFQRSAQLALYDLLKTNSANIFSKVLAIITRAPYQGKKIYV